MCIRDRENTIYPYLKKNAVQRLLHARAIAEKSGMLKKSIVHLGGYTWCLFPWLGTRSFRTMRRFIKEKTPSDFGLSGLESVSYTHLFSFSEYMQYFGYSDKYAAVDKYMIEGGMAGSYLYKDQEAKYDYIADVFNTLIVRDIRNKYKIRNMQLMDRLVDFLMDNISNLTSARNITNTFSGLKEKVNHVTISSYIQYLCNAFAFYKVRRYDIKGKKYLASNDKYYLSDHTFRYAKLGTKNMDLSLIHI